MLLNKLLVHWWCRQAFAGTDFPVHGIDSEQQAIQVILTCEGYESFNIAQLGYRYEALGFVESKMAFSAGVQSGSAEVGSDGDVILHSGNCNVQGFAFGQNKPGGTPPENATD